MNPSVPDQQRAQATRRGEIVHAAIDGLESLTHPQRFGMHNVVVHYLTTRHTQISLMAGESAPHTCPILTYVPELRTKPHQRVAATIADPFGWDQLFSLH